jgi:hypothetical protein
VEARRETPTPRRLYPGRQEAAKLAKAQGLGHLLKKINYRPSYLLLIKENSARGTIGIDPVITTEDSQETGSVT